MRALRIVAQVVGVLVCLWLALGFAVHPAVATSQGFDDLGYNLAIIGGCLYGAFCCAFRPWAR